MPYVNRASPKKQNDLYFAISGASYSAAEQHDQYRNIAELVCVYDFILRILNIYNIMMAHLS